MPRLPRLDAPETLHHVIGRGIERGRIFRGESDQKDFVNRLANLSREKTWRVYSRTEVARYLGVTTSAVNRAKNADEVPELRDYL
jgi:hypothetical protein